ncbi:MAG: hypothetical protein PHW41_03000 [Eubacteriales bacterium]|nr:hypothetical protein [Eubacteriales bacterium]
METNETRNPETNPNNDQMENKADQLPPEELDDLQKKVHDLPEEKWNLYQYIGGGVMGLVCGFLLTTVSGYPSIGMYGTIAAALLALFGPRMIEKRVKRTVQKGRIAMMIALGVWLLGNLLFMLLSGVPIISKAA